MRHRHSETKRPSQPPHPSQPPAGGTHRDREDRSRRADVGAAPEQDDRPDLDDDRDEDREVEDEGTGKTKHGNRKF